jgi:hypothetical protein
VAYNYGLVMNQARPEMFGEMVVGRSTFSLTVYGIPKSDPALTVGALSTKKFSYVNVTLNFCAVFSALLSNVIGLNVTGYAL